MLIYILLPLGYSRVQPFNNSNLSSECTVPISMSTNQDAAVLKLSAMHVTGTARAPENNSAAPALCLRVWRDD